MAFSKFSCSQVSSSKLYSFSNSRSNFLNRNSNPYSYAQAVKNQPPSQTQRSPNRVSKSKWIDSIKGKKFCFRCGDINHVANQCQNPIRCFSCGFFGHKSKDCLKFSSFSDSCPKLVDHGFQFVLKCMLLKGILLDHLWHKREEGIQYLEGLFYHIDIINAPNIGKGNKDRYGDPEESFGSSDSISDSSEDSFLDSYISENSAAVSNELRLDFDPILLDPAVSKCKEELSSFSLEHSLVEIGKVKEKYDSNGFSIVNSKRLKSREHGSFKILTSNKFDCLTTWLDSNFSTDSQEDDCGLFSHSENSQSIVSSDYILKSEIIKGVNVIDNSFSSVIWMDWSDKLGNLDFELLEQDVIVSGSNMSEECIVYGLKNFVVNTMLYEINCFVKGLDVSSVDISYETIFPEIRSVSEIHHGDISAVSYYDVVYSVTFDYILDWDIILSDDDDNIMDEEAFVCIDKMLNVEREMSLCTDMHKVSNRLESLSSNLSAGVLALDFANNLDDVGDVLNVVPMESIDKSAIGDGNVRLEKLYSVGLEQVNNMVNNKVEKKQYLEQGPSKCLGDLDISGQVEKRGHSNKQASDDCLVTMKKDSDCRIGRYSASCSSSLRRGRQKTSVKASGSIQRSARIRCSGTQSSIATVSAFSNEVSGSKGDCLVDQVESGLKKIASNESKDMENSKLQ